MEQQFSKTLCNKAYIIRITVKYGANFTDLSKINLVRIRRILIHVFLATHRPHVRIHYHDVFTFTAEPIIKRVVKRKRNGIKQN